MLAGALFGLAVHWRIYPVIYALPVLLSLQPPLTPPLLPAGRGGSHTAVGGQPARTGTGGIEEVLQGGQTGHPGDAEPPAAPYTVSQQSGNGNGSGSGIGSGPGSSTTGSQLMCSLFSRQRLAFCCAAAAVFLGLAALFHRLYGWQFIQASPAREHESDSAQSEGHRTASAGKAAMDPSMSEVTMLNVTASTGGISVPWAAA